MKVVIKQSNKKGKKFMATFTQRSLKDQKLKDKIIHFGSAGMSDFTKHKDPLRKERYLKRHKKRENWQDPLTAGALSRWILWNKPTLSASIKDYKSRFNL